MALSHHTFPTRQRSQASLTICTQIYVANLHSWSVLALVSSIDFLNPCPLKGDFHVISHLLLSCSGVTSVPVAIIAMYAQDTPLPPQSVSQGEPCGAF